MAAIWLSKAGRAGHFFTVARTIVQSFKLKGAAEGERKNRDGGWKRESEWTDLKEVVRVGVIHVFDAEAPKSSNMST